MRYEKCTRGQAVQVLGVSGIRGLSQADEKKKGIVEKRNIVIVCLDQN